MATRRASSVRDFGRLHRRLLLLIGALAIAAAATALATWWSRTPSAAPQRPELQWIVDQLVVGKDAAAPGATAYVSGPHGTWAGAAGVANVKTGEPMPVDARMRLESVSKAWTATLILQLVGEHRMGLDDTVEHWLPGLLPYGDQITIRELLNHTSGLIQNDENDLGDPLQTISRVRDPALRAQLQRTAQRLAVNPALRFPSLLWIKFAAALPLVAPPGTTYHYSNIGYEVAGLVAEKVGGMPLARLYDERIIKPLRLESAAYDPQGDITGPHPRAYRVNGDGTLDDTTAQHPGVGAEGGIVTDARDEARFLTALMRGELLAPAQLAALKSPPAIESVYGLGIVVDQSDCAGIVYQHNGGGPGFKTSVFVAGDGKRVAVLLLNGATGDGRADQAVYDAAKQLYCAA